VLVIGAGSIGERHLRCFGQTGRAVMSVCEPNEKLRQRIENSYRVQRCSANLDDFLTDPPDVAVICTPAQMHLPMATRLAEAGVHLLIEKPLGTSDAGADELVEIAQRRRITTAVAYVLRTNPSLSAMREAIHSGRFGKPVQLVFVSGQNFPFFRPAYR
jgi:predicted dehydrogenase